LLERSLGDLRKQWLQRASSRTKPEAMWNKVSKTKAKLKPKAKRKPKEELNKAHTKPKEEQEEGEPKAKTKPKARWHRDIQMHMQMPEGTMQPMAS